MSQLLRAGTQGKLHSWCRVCPGADPVADFGMDLRSRSPAWLPYAHGHSGLSAYQYFHLKSPSAPGPPWLLPSVPFADAASWLSDSCLDQLTAADGPALLGARRRRRRADPQHHADVTHKVSAQVPGGGRLAQQVCLRQPWDILLFSILPMFVHRFSENSHGKRNHAPCIHP